MASLSELLEEQARGRVAQMPSLDTPKGTLEPAFSAPIQQEEPATNPGLEGLLPLLMGGRGGMQSGMQGPGPQGDAGHWQNVAHRIASNRYGYDNGDLNKLDYIIGNESSWDPHALNPDSGAAGIAQNISGFSGGYSENDPKEQIRWLLNYLDSHQYDQGVGIDAAYAHKKQTGWY